jgi:hypothetical protein
MSSSTQRTSAAPTPQRLDFHLHGWHCVKGQIAARLLENSVLSSNINKRQPLYAARQTPSASQQRENWPRLPPGAERHRPCATGAASPSCGRPRRSRSGPGCRNVLSFDAKPIPGLGLHHRTHWGSLIGVGVAIGIGIESAHRSKQPARYQSLLPTLTPTPTPTPKPTKHP